MSSRLVEIFEDEKIVNKIKSRLPYLFKIAELEKFKSRQSWNGSWFNKGEYSN